ncbi:SURF1 family protein [Microbacterium sp. SLBN-154]|uniref:SURF1 family cytochrome oxidase biogenesis protein n=1 Tax=Microbacterium sp. SLBN-154 TaxID=2768458 RepID=UPI001154AFD9|nr:SURF1 family cytochrome oxidase biogenesis protein [Microbacterium sp. SLBN-154]TQK18742.1 SURF1 family protein [Microbacterium sp. SLBN-154]
MTQPAPLPPPAPTQEFPPTLREVLIRPQWIALLALSLVVAGLFAWLGQWQLGRAIDTAPLPPGATEQVRPLAEVSEPGEYLPEPFVGQRVAVSGTWVPGDFIVVSSRFNDGVEGFWVTGQLRVADTAVPTSIAVAVGWAPTQDAAEAAVERLNADADAGGAAVAIEGRLISDEGAVPPPSGADPQTLIRMSPAALLSRWSDTAGLEVYRSYIVAEVPQGGLDEIVSAPPEAGSAVNWLNVFYAAEWVIFAGFAFYLWYRLAKDAWEKEVEDLEDARAASSA